MKQLQALKTCIEQPNPVTQERTKCFFGSGLPFRWEVEVTTNIHYLVN